MSRENVYDIFKRESVDTVLLPDIESVLQYEFVAIGPRNFQDTDNTNVEELRKEL